MVSDDAGAREVIEVGGAAQVLKGAGDRYGIGADEVDKVLKGAGALEGVGVVEGAGVAERAGVPSLELTDLL